MRREKKEKLNSRRKFPLFWKKCECCESEYMLEWVWGFIINTFQGMTYTNHIVCRSCAETRQDADKFAIAYTKIRNDDFPPMPPEKPPKKSAEKKMERRYFKKDDTCLELGCSNALPPRPTKRILREDVKPIGPPNRVFKPCGAEWDDVG